VSKRRCLHEDPVLSILLLLIVDNTLHSTVIGQFLTLTALFILLLLIVDALNGVYNESEFVYAVTAAEGIILSSLFIGRKQR